MVMTDHDKKHYVG